MNQIEFAKVAGLTKGRVSQLVAEGRPVDSDRRIDADAGRAWIAANLDPDRRRGGGRRTDLRGLEAVAKPPRRPKAPGKLESVAALRGKKLQREGRLLDLELRRKTGEVVDRAKVERAIFDRARFERDSWLAFSSRATAALAAEAEVDPGRAFPVIDRLICEHLSELANLPLPRDDQPVSGQPGGDEDGFR